MARGGRTRPRGPAAAALLLALLAASSLAVVAAPAPTPPRRAGGGWTPFAGAGTAKKLIDDDDASVDDDDARVATPPKATTTMTARDEVGTGRLGNSDGEIAEAFRARDGGATREETRTRTRTRDDDDDDRPFCARCDGCVVNWTAASLAAESDVDCRGHAPCGSCDLDLARINQKVSLASSANAAVPRDEGASAASVLRAANYSTDADAKPFVKFVCIPGLPRHGTECARGEPWEPEDRLVNNTLSLQRLSDFCGLESVSTRSWVARVRGVAPAGMPLDPRSAHPDPVPIDQRGIFSSPAPGVALSALCDLEEGGGGGGSGAAAEMLREIPSHAVAEAALFDFVFCAGDRHTQNVYVDAFGRLTLIDNDGLLGQQVWDPSLGRPVVDGRLCAVSSLFLPGTLESWRLRRSTRCGGALSTLDYRCHVGASGETRLKPKLRRCLAHFAASSPDALVAEFGLAEMDFARTLATRARDLLEVGLPAALHRAMKKEREISVSHAEALPTNLTWDELEALGDESAKKEMMAWRESTWRPTEAPVCRGLTPKWDDAPFDYRVDDAQSLD